MRQMFAEEFVELGAVLGVVLRAIPPVPVAAFRNHQLLEGKLALVGGEPAAFPGSDDAIIRFTRLQQQVPSLIVFFRADPDIEVGVNPGARMDAREFTGRYAGQRLADRDRFDVRRLRDAGVKRVEEGRPL